MPIEGTVVTIVTPGFTKTSGGTAVEFTLETCPVADVITGSSVPVNISTGKGMKSLAINVAVAEH